MKEYIEHNIKTKYGMIYCKTYGEGTPIIFLHGGPGLMHDYLVPHFIQLKSKFNLIFFDQIGSGKSTISDINMTLTIEDFVIVIEDIRKYFNLNQFHLISHSFGGILAVKYALSYPNVLLSNIMISPAPGNDSLDKEARKILQSRLTESDTHIIQEIMSTSPIENNDIIALNRFLKINEKNRYFNKFYLDEFYQDFSLEDIKNLQMISAKLYKELDDYNYYPELNEISANTIIIHGDYDPIPLSSSKLYKDSIKNSSLHIIKDCGHFPFIEKNDEVIEIIKKILF